MTGKASCTLGPWKIGEVERTEKGARIPILTPDSDENNYHPVCWINGNGRMETGGNALLIAVAPRLLEMCKRALAVFRMLPPSVANTKNIAFDLEEAIAKAEGR